MQQTINAYAHCYDGGDFVRLAQLFVADARFSVTPASFMPEPLVGVDAIMASFRERWEVVRGSGVTRRHVCTGTVFDSASSSCVETRTYLTTIDAGAEPRVVNLGVYHDTLAPCEDSWRFVSRRLELAVSI